MIDRIRKSLQSANGNDSSEPEPSNSDPEDSMKQWKTSIAQLQKLRKKLRQHASQMQQRKDQHLEVLSTLQQKIDQLLSNQQWDEAEHQLIKKITLQLKVEKVNKLLKQLKEKGQDLTWSIEKMELKLEEFELALSFKKDAEKRDLLMNMETLHLQYLQSFELDPQFDTYSLATDEIDETLQNIELKGRVAAELKASRDRSAQLKQQKEQRDWETMEKRFSRHFKDVSSTPQTTEKVSVNVDEFFKDQQENPSDNKEQSIKEFFQETPRNDWDTFFKD